MLHKSTRLSFTLLMSTIIKVGKNHDKKDGFILFTYDFLSKKIFYLNIFLP